MRAEPFSLGGMPALRWGRPSRQGILYLHGQGGSKAEAAFFAAAAADAGWQTVSVDLPGHGDRESEAAALVPWQVVPELRCALAELRGRWDRVGLFGSSLGAWFGLLAYPDAPLAGALFLSPVVDMEALIRKMMGWAGVSEERLAQEGRIPTTFGQTLSWEYLRYVRTHPARRWRTPTAILYGARDHLTDRETVEALCRPEWLPPDCGGGRRALVPHAGAAGGGGPLAACLPGGPGIREQRSAAPHPRGGAVI